MLKNFFSMFAKQPSVVAKVAPSAHVPAKPSPVGAPVYPPVDQGVAFGSAEAVLETQKDLIRRLRLGAGMDHAEFDILYGSVLRSLANYVDLLPASAAGTHMGAGGLFRLALEIGFYSRQAAEAVIFAGREGVELRRNLEPRWRYATFLAGLCCELYRPLSRMVVVSEKGEEWPMHRMGMGEWLASIQAKRYFIRWVEEDQQFVNGSASVIASRIIPDSAMQYLQEGHGKIISAMLDAVVIDAAQTKNNQIAEIVARMRRKVIDRDTVLAPQNYGRLTVGSHLEPHLIGAMRQLVRDGVWVCNQKKSRLWYGKDGMFIVWRTAFKEMREVLERGGVAGIPQDATTLAETLLKADVFVADSTGDLYWKIKTPLGESELVAVRLSSPDLLLVAIEDEPQPEPLDVDLVVQEARKTASEPLVINHVAPPVPEQEIVKPTVIDKPLEPPAPDSPQSTTTPRDDRPSKPKRPPKANPEVSGPGAIEAVPESSGIEIPDDVAGSMSPTVRSVMSHLLKDYHAGELASVIEKQTEGVAISMEHLASYGVEVTKIMIELSNLGWLYTAPENPKRKIHPATIQNRQVQSAILKTQVALDLGFKV